MIKKENKGKHTGDQGYGIYNALTKIKKRKKRRRKNVDRK